MSTYVAMPSCHSYINVTAVHHCEYDIAVAKILVIIGCSSRDGGTVPASYILQLALPVINYLYAF